MLRRIFLSKFNDLMSSSVGQQKLVPFEQSPTAGSFSSLALAGFHGLGPDSSASSASSLMGGEGGLNCSDVLEDL